MDEFTEDIFDEEKIKTAVKKGKRKTLITIVLVSVIVFIVLNVINFATYFYFSEEAYKKWDAYIRLTTPNGYISETMDTRGLLGGETHYKVSKDMKIKKIVIEQKRYQFGLFPPISISRASGGKIGVTGEDWQFKYKENGWRELLFFHPNITYKKYKNDKDLINEMEGDKIFEVALSFDKPYKLKEMPIVEFPEMTWFWVNTYSDNQLKTLKQEAEDYIWSATFIRENEALGFSIRNRINSTVEMDYEYHKFLTLLQTSFAKDHQNAYNLLKDKNIEDIEILGIVVYGTKDEILEMMNKPFVKAISLGGVIENY